MHNYINKPFRVVIIHYAERVREVHNLAEFLLPHLKKGVSITFQIGPYAKKSEDEIRVATKDGLPS